MSIEDYDIISILGDSISSASYKVRNKTTNKIVVWQTTDYTSLTDSEKSKLVKKIQKRINLKHPNILQFFDYIDQKENKLLYLVAEYCINGSLQKLLTYSKENKIVLQEEFICRILYQIVLTIKTVEEFSGGISGDEVFFDDEYNVKLYNYNFSTGNKNKFKDIKMSTLGMLLFEVCTLKNFNKNSFEEECKDLCSVYSSSLISLIIHMIKDNNDLKKNLDKILCHPTLLLKSSKWNKDLCFVKISGLSSNSDTVQVSDSSTKKQNTLRNRELALQVRERKLLDKEQKLINREKKLVIMEKILNEKLMQAELYLKRCKENKSVNHIPKTEQNKLSYENLDSTYVDCGDSVILPTSKKLDVNNIVKPAPFTRTLSEKRIRFKGHSPLKELDMNKRKSIRIPKKRDKPISECSSDWRTCSENDSEISSIDGVKKTIINHPKQLFVDAVCENEYEVPPDCRPISWTEESKKYAFEMLRIMNGNVGKENNSNWEREIRHTHL